MTKRDDLSEEQNLARVAMAVEFKRKFLDLQEKAQRNMLRGFGIDTDMPDTYTTIVLNKGEDAKKSDGHDAKVREILEQATKNMIEKSSQHGYPLPDSVTSANATIDVSVQSSDDEQDIPDAPPKRVH
jgi:hypothetical protein